MGSAAEEVGGIKMGVGLASPRRAAALLLNRISEWAEWRYPFKDRCQQSR